MTIAGPTRAALLPAQAGPTLVLVLLAPVVPGIAAHFGPDGRLAAQLIVTFPFFGLIVGSLLSGFAIHRLGLRRLIQIAYAGWIVSGTIGLLATGLPLLLAGCALLGVCAALFTSCLAAMTSILFSGDERARMVGIQSAAASIIGVALTLLTAAVAARFGWRTPYAAIIAFGATLLIFSSLCLPRFPHADAGERYPLGNVLARIWPICLAGTTIFVLATNESTHLPFLLESGGLDSASLRSYVTISTPCAGVFGAIFFSLSQGKLATRTLILIAGSFFAAGWAIFGIWTGGLMIAMSAAALIGIAMGIVSPLMFTTLMRTVPGKETGTAMGLLNVAIFFGSFINPIVTAPLRTIVGASGLMLWTAAVALTVSVIAACSVRTDRISLTGDPC